MALVAYWCALLFLCLERVHLPLLGARVLHVVAVAVARVELLAAELALSRRAHAVLALQVSAPVAVRAEALATHLTHVRSRPVVVARVGVHLMNVTHQPTGVHTDTLTHGARQVRKELGSRLQANKCARFIPSSPWLHWFLSPADRVSAVASATATADAL